MASESALRIVAEARLSPISRRIAECLADHFGEWLPRERVASTVYFDRLDGGPVTAWTTITNLLRFCVKPRLSEKNITIESCRGGLRMRWTEEP